MNGRQVALTAGIGAGAAIAAIFAIGFAMIMLDTPEAALDRTVSSGATPEQIAAAKRAVGAEARADALAAEVTARWDAAYELADTMHGPIAEFNLQVDEINDLPRDSGDFGTAAGMRKAAARDAAHIQRTFEGLASEFRTLSNMTARSADICYDAVADWRAAGDDWRADDLSITCDDNADLIFVLSDEALEAGALAADWGMYRSWLG